MFDRGVSIFDTINKSVANFIANMSDTYIFVNRNCVAGYFCLCLSPSTTFDQSEYIFNLNSNFECCFIFSVAYEICDS